MPQAEFAARFGFSLDTLRKWKQKRTMPDKAARADLTVLPRDPEGRAARACTQDNARRSVYASGRRMLAAGNAALPG